MSSRWTAVKIDADDSRVITGKASSRLAVEPKKLSSFKSLLSRVATGYATAQWQGLACWRFD